MGSTTCELEKTVAVLVRSANESAATLLVQALDSTHPLVGEAALRGLAQRWSPTGKDEIVRRWHLLRDSGKRTLANHARRMSEPLRQALHADDEQLVRNACDAALVLRDYDVIPALLAVAESPDHWQAGLAADTAVELASALSNDLAAPRRNYRHQRDCIVAREHALAALEHAVGRFERHRQRAVVEAFLVLASRQCAVLNRVLLSAKESAYATSVYLLCHSSRPGILRLLTSFLGEEAPPAAVRGILARRTDTAFVAHLRHYFTEHYGQHGLRAGNLLASEHLQSELWMLATRVREAVEAHLLAGCEPGSAADAPTLEPADSATMAGGVL